MKAGIFLLILITISAAVPAQKIRYLIELTDKSHSGYSLESPSAFLSKRALDRRERQHIPVDSTDLPVSGHYLDSIRSVANVTVLNISNWLNQVAIITDDQNAVSKISSFPFVKSARRAGARRMHAGVDSKSSMSLPAGIDAQRTAASNHYGKSFDQIHMHSGDYLHTNGFHGENILIAIFDAGFYGYKTNQVFDSLRQQRRILGERDLVDNDGSVNEDDYHGMACFSIIAANRPGLMVGSAPGAFFYLFRTEDRRSEYPIEEQNWAVAAQLADSMGADIISSSLGYSSHFTDPRDDHHYAERDGNSSLVTRAADLAAKKGMIVMNSAGNDGGEAGEAKFVACPADGDSVVAVGAIDNAGNLAPFSSIGPNGAGKQKPDFVSLGVATVIAGTDGAPVSGNGTSYSNPNLAGLVACLWQAFPEFGNMEIIDAVRRSSDRYTKPDNRFGYGIPDFQKAYNILFQQRTAREYRDVLENSWIQAYPVPARDRINIVFRAPASGEISLRLLDLSGRLLETRNMTVEEGAYYTSAFSLQAALPAGVYLVQYRDGWNSKSVKVAVSR